MKESAELRHMGATPLQRLFHPESIAVIGASRNQRKVGYTVLKNLVAADYRGKIFAINPKYDSVGSTPCFESLLKLDESVDLAIICTPVHAVSDVVQQCGECNVGGVVVLTAGFQETGEEGRKCQEELKAIAEVFPDTRVIGPNCVGVINTASNLNASFARGMPKAGRVSFISQSGALCTSVLDWALQEDIGFANLVSIGNMMDVGWGELIEYFSDDPDTDAMVLYIESVHDADRFIEAALRCTNKKPIIAYKAGRYSQSAAAAASHTGALAGEDVVYDAVFRRLGIQRVFSMEEMFDSAEALARIRRMVPGFQRQEDSGEVDFGRLAIVSNAGGPAVMATDALIELDGRLAELSSNTITELNNVLPPNWSKQNPVDVIGDATPERLAQATEVVLRDPRVDAVLVIVSPQAMTNPEECASSVMQVASRHQKPILATWMGGMSIGPAVDKMNHGGLPTFPTPERAVRAFVSLANYKQREIGASLASLPDSGRPEVSRLPTEVDAKHLLSDYHIDVVPTRLANSEEEAVELANEFGFPVALKIASPEIAHKSDFGGVQLDLQSANQVREAFRTVIAAAHQHHPQKIIMGVSVQPMVDVSEGYELIAGIKRDPVFGPVVMIGAGGINAEVFKDVAFELPPLDVELAGSMLRSLKSWPILDGFRGQPVLNTESVINALIKLSHLSLDCPEIRELDINPLLVTPERAVALDARIIRVPGALVQTA